MDCSREHDVGVGKRFVGRYRILLIAIGMSPRLHSCGYAVLYLVPGRTIAPFAYRSHAKGDRRWTSRLSNTSRLFVSIVVFLEQLPNLASRLRAFRVRWRVYRKKWAHRYFQWAMVWWGRRCTAGLFLIMRWKLMLRCLLCDAKWRRCWHTTETLFESVLSLDRWAISVKAL